METTKITARNQIQPLTSDSYALRVVDPTKGFFVLVDLLNERYSNVFKDTMGQDALFISYECFKDCHIDGVKYFDGLCKRFIEDDNNTTINN